MTEARQAITVMITSIISYTNSLERRKQIPYNIPTFTCNHK